MQSPTKKTTKELQPSDDSSKLASACSPLRKSVFRALWIATVVSNIGTWMQDVGESWLMTSLTPSPVLVALVETAGSLPVVLLALPAGALADVVDRRRLLLLMQSWMVVAAGANPWCFFEGRKLYNQEAELRWQQTMNAQCRTESGSDRMLSSTMK